MTRPCCTSKKITRVTIVKNNNNAGAWRTLTERTTILIQTFYEVSAEKNMGTFYVKTSAICINVLNNAVQQDIVKKQALSRPSGLYTSCHRLIKK